MTGEFARHRSTRWVKTDMPSYGDEWDDYYDYEEEEMTEHEEEATDSQILRRSLGSLKEDNEAKNEEDVDKEGKENKAASMKSLLLPLVLSVDDPGQRNSNSDLSSLDEITEKQENEREKKDKNLHNTSSDLYFEGKNIYDLHTPHTESGILSSEKFVEKAPSQTSSNQGDERINQSQISELGKLSDSDDKSIREVPSRLSIVRDEITTEVPKGEEDVNKKADENNITERREPDLNSKGTGNSFSSVTSKEKNPYEPLVLSTDRDKDDIHSSSEEWGYNGEDTDSDSIGDIPEKEEDNMTDEQTDEAKNQPTLDGLLYDLKKASLDDKVLGEAADDSKQISEKDRLSDELDFSFTFSQKSDINKEDPKDKTLDVTKGDATKDKGVDHQMGKGEEESYLGEEASDKSSSLDSDIHATKKVARPVPKKNDANDYIPEGGNVDYVGMYSERGEVEKDPLGRTDTVRSLRVERDKQHKDGNFPPNNRQQGVAESPKDVARETNDEDDDFSRRSSYRSVSTFNMGSWKPNTDNYRNQFINDNDNVSTMNMSMYGNESNKIYKKFVNQRSISGASMDAISEQSSVSIPETMDIPLPSISEDAADIEPQGSHEDLVEMQGDDRLPSLLQDHPHKQIFREEKVTPLNSTDTVNVPKSAPKQRYSSLLSTSDDIPRPNAKDAKDSADFKDSRDFKDAKDTRDAEASLQKKGTLRVASSESQLTLNNSPVAPPNLYNWKAIMSTSQPVDRIRLLKEANMKEALYDTGLQEWINAILKLSNEIPNIHIGKLASEAYQNAPHNDITRHLSLRSKVSVVRDKMENSGIQASNLGKRFLNRGKKFMKSGAD